MFVYIIYIQHLDRCESYTKMLKTKEIDGLKLMELSFGDLASMGIKGVAEQQSIIDIIDCELRVVAYACTVRYCTVLVYTYLIKLNSIFSSIHAVYKENV